MFIFQLNFDAIFSLLPFFSVLLGNGEDKGFGKSKSRGKIRGRHRQGHWHQQMLAEHSSRPAQRFIHVALDFAYQGTRVLSTNQPKDNTKPNVLCARRLIRWWVLWRWKRSRTQHMTWSEGSTNKFVKSKRYSNSSDLFKVQSRNFILLAFSPPVL